MLNLRGILEQIGLQRETKVYNDDFKSNKLPQIRKGHQSLTQHVKSDYRYVSLSLEKSIQQKQRRFSSKEMKIVNLLLKTNSDQQEQKKHRKKNQNNRGRYQTMGEIVQAIKIKDSHQKAKSLEVNKYKERKVQKRIKQIRQINQYFKKIIYANRIRQDLPMLNSVGIKSKMMNKQEQIQERQQIVETKSQKQKYRNKEHIQREFWIRSKRELNNSSEVKAAVINYKMQRRNDKLHSQYGPWHSTELYCDINMQ